MERFQLITKINENNINFTYRVYSISKTQVTFRHCTDSQVTYNLKHCTLPVLHCDISAHKVSDEFDYGTNQTRTSGVICP